MLNCKSSDFTSKPIKHAHPSRRAKPISRTCRHEAHRAPKSNFEQANTPAFAGRQMRFAPKKPRSRARERSHRRCNAARRSRGRAERNRGASRSACERTRCGCGPMSPSSKKAKPASRTRSRTKMTSLDSRGPQKKPLAKSFASSRRISQAQPTIAGSKPELEA